MTMTFLALVSLPPSAVDQAPPAGHAANPLSSPRTDQPRFPRYVPSALSPLLLPGHSVQWTWGPWPGRGNTGRRPHGWPAGLCSTLLASPMSAWPVCSSLTCVHGVQSPRTTPPPPGQAPPPPLGQIWGGAGDPARADFELLGARPIWSTPS